MSTERELLAAIAAAPGDDAPRLVYADWLLERGKPLGELISLQCALERVPDREPLSPRRRDPRFLRARALLERFRHDWAPRMKGVSRIRFRRGLPEEVEAAPEVLRDREAELWETFPLLRRVAVRFPLGPDLPLGALLALPAIARLEGLSLSTGRDERWRIGPRLAEAIAPLPRLRELALDQTDLDPQSLEALATTGALPSLESLSVRQNWYLRDARGWSEVWRLRTLDVSMSGCGPGALAWLLRDGSGRLETLRAARSGGEVPAENAAGISRAPGLANLRELDVSGSGRYLARAIALSPLPRDLHLCVAGCPLGDLFSAIADRPELANLAALDLSDTFLTLKDLAAIARSTSLRRLPVLDRNREIGDDGAVLLADSPLLARSEELNASDCRIGETGGIAIASSSALSKLEVLDLALNEALGDRTAHRLASRDLPALVRVDLRATAVSAGGALAILEAPGLPSLREVLLPDAAATSPDVARAMQERLGLAPLALP